MGKREDAMQRREERAAETLAAREGAEELREAGLPQSWLARLHPRDRRGKFRETMHPARLADPSLPHLPSSPAGDFRAGESAAERQARVSDAPEHVKTMASEHLRKPAGERVAALKGMSDEQLSNLQKRYLNQANGPMVAEVGSEMGKRFHASRWQQSHAGGGGITDTQGHYVHGWAGKTSSGRYSATLTDAKGVTATGEGHSPQAAAESAHQNHLAGNAKPKWRSITSGLPPLAGER